MNQLKIKQTAAIFFAFIICLAATNFVQAQTTAFTYQGRLTDSAMPASGSYDMQFRLFDNPNAGQGTQQGATVTNPSVTAANGVFTVTLDFGASAFANRTQLYLEISVRPANSSGGYTSLAPRQAITSAPTAIQSLNAANANQLGGVAANNYLQANGSGANLTNLNASNITSGNLSDAQLSANVAFRNQANTFTGNQTVNGNLTQTGTTADLNLTSGFVARGFFGTGAIPATGAGIRMMFYPGKAAFRAGYAISTTWDDANVGSFSTALGYNTKASGSYSTALGYSTTASSDYSTALGYSTTASGNYSTALGYSTTASGNYSTALGGGTTASGVVSTALGNFTVASGDNSTAMGYFASTNGLTGSFVYGDASKTSDFNAIAPNSFTMRATGGFATVGTFGTGAIPATGAGTRMMFYPNKAAFRAGTVSGTQWDDANIGNYSTALGIDATASGIISTAIGSSTTANGVVSTALGRSTTASGDYSTAIGNFTTASGDYSTAIGSSTTANGLNSTAMGYSTTASGSVSTAMGYFASTNGMAGSFVYGDNSTSSTVTATAANQFVVRASGGFRFRTNSALTTGCDLAAGSGAFSCTSTKSLKENFAPTSGGDVLRRLRTIPINYWNYIGEQSGVRHIGAFAEDFYTAFKLGADDKSIGLLDVAGVNMAATKALDEKTDDLQSQIQTQRQIIERQQRQIDELKQIICTIKPDAVVCKEK